VFCVRVPAAVCLHAVCLIRGVVCSSVPDNTHTHPNTHTHTHTVTYMSAGRFFGEMSLLTGTPRSASIRAEESCKLIQVTRDALAPLIRAMPQIADQIAEVITTRRYDAQRKATLVHTQQQMLAMAETEELSRTVQSFFGMRKKQVSDDALSNTIQGLLIAPVQRIPRYLLLLKRLIKLTPEDWECWESLQMAADTMASLADNLNLSKEKSDNAFAVYQIQMRIVAMPSPLVSPGRYLVKEFTAHVTLGWPHVKLKSMRTVFLFNNAIVLGEMPITGNKHQYVARMDLGRWSTAKLQAPPSFQFTVHMEEVTWAFQFEDRQKTEETFKVVESVLNSVPGHQAGSGPQ